ncbi:MAG TPA: CoA pyrophosphatase [Gemmatimonadaceae bacterium]|nr:CoA pyrophosphatase [Gemmatimonadaceae bacterium]
MSLGAGNPLGDDSAASVLVRPLVARLLERLQTRATVEIETGAEGRRAAVALVLRAREREPVELLMIKRATYAGDPWSGHFALPGGRQEPGETIEQTVVRETREETALDLSRNGAILGRLDDVQPRTVALPRFVITPFVVVVAGDAALTLSDEVAEAFWIPVDALRAPEATREVVLEMTGGPRRMPTFQHGGRTIWGLTERILRQFLALTSTE